MNFSFAQKTDIYVAENASYNEALDLFKKEKYTDAYQKFEWFLNQHANYSHQLTENAAFYKAISALRLFQKNAELGVMQYLTDYPSGVYENDSKLELARYFYAKQKWKKVIEFLEKADLSLIPADEMQAYYFRFAYSYFMEKNYKKASKYFFQLVGSDNEYSAPSTYYISHISYENKEYMAALEGFLKIENHPKFSFIVPYYISQIYYQLGKYDELIEYAEPKVDSVIPERQIEISRMLGEAYYQLKDYKNAIKYLAKTNGKSREEKYHLGYAYYKNKDFSNAIDILQTALVEHDSLDQIIYYHLADCYVQSNQKKYAFNAYSEVSKMEHDKALQEDAFFSMAKISYETSYDPYQQTVEHLVYFINTFKTSARQKEAIDLLLNIFLITNNYKASIEQMEKLELKYPKLQEAYQKACFNYGVELFQLKNYTEAIVNFQKSQKYTSEKYIHGLASYWIAETYYRLKNYDQSIQFYQEFIFKPGSIILSEFAYAHYNLGYSFYHKKDYDEALTWFRKFISDDEIEDSLMYTDALVKTADIYYIKKSFDVSLEYYTKALLIGKKNADYALYQKAILEGILDQAANKQASLEQLIKKYPNSTYQPEAKFQLSRLYFDANKPNDALKLLDQIIVLHPNSAPYQKAMLEKAQVYYNTDQTTKAIEAYKQYIANFPNYNDAQVALNQIKKIYSENDKLQEYKNYISTLTFLNLSKASIDSTAYETAYFQYIEGRNENAIRGFKDYIDDVNNGTYPGLFKVSAHFYRAEAYFNTKEYSKALNDYDFVIQQPFNLFSEKSLLKATRISFSDKNYKEALKNYIALEQVGEYKSNLWEAKIGQMRCYYQLQNHDAALNYANRVLENSEASEDEKLEAHYISAHSAFQLKNYVLAKQHYQQVLEQKSSAYYSEALFQLANINFIEKDYQTAENNIMSLINGDVVNKHWMARGMILLSDVYVTKSELFQAKHTLETVIDNHDEPDLIQQAKDKLQEINALEEKQKEEDAKKKELPEIKIDNGMEWINE